MVAMPKMGLAALLLIPNLNCFGATFCAVKVFVTDLAGKPAAAGVRLLDSEGKVVTEAVSERGEASFCDFGFGDHSIEVGANTYAHTIIPNVRVLFGRTLKYWVYLNEGGQGDVIPIGCTTYYRIASPQGERLPGASVTSEPPGIQVRADDYGRALVNLATHETFVLVFSKPGYAPARLDVDCTRPDFLERSITLSPDEK
jgi:hypothetical protein